MDALTTTLAQLRDLFRRMSVGQQAVVLAVPSLLLIAFVWLIIRSPESPLVPVALGKTMSAEQLASAEAVLREHGLSEFQRQGDQLCVPADRVDDYNAALLLHGGLPDDLSSDWNQTLESTSLFTTRAQLDELKESDLKNELARIIQAVPGIAQATVRWADESPAERFSRQQKRKATVFVVPERETVLSEDLVHALRHGVASAVSDLEPDHVTVFDVKAGRAFTQTTGSGAWGAQAVQTANELSRVLKQRLADRLSYIDGIRIGVFVNVDEVQRFLPASTGRPVSGSTAVAPEPAARVANANRTVLSAGMVSNPTRELRIEAPSGPRDVSEFEGTTSGGSRRQFVEHALMTLQDSVQVTVGIPKSYYFRIMELEGHRPGNEAAQQRAYQRALEQKQRNVESEVAQTVASILGGRSADVHVNSIVDTEQLERLSRPPVVSGWEDRVRNWGGACGLGLLALLAFRSLTQHLNSDQRTAGRSQGTAPEFESQSQDRLYSEAAETQESLESRRERVESVVRQRPEMAAALLSRWIDSSEHDM